jgi:hypothetical protein
LEGKDKPVRTEREQEGRLGTRKRMTDFKG